MSEKLDNLFSRIFGRKSPKEKTKELPALEDGQREIEATQRKKAEIEKTASRENRQAAKQMYKQMLRDAEAGKETPLPIAQIRQILDTMEKETTEKEK